MLLRLTFLTGLDSRFLLFTRQEVLRYDPPAEIVIQSVMCAFPPPQCSGQLAGGVLDTLSTVWVREAARDVTNYGFELEGSGFHQKRRFKKVAI
jgi:hypothetical protein